MGRQNEERGHCSVERVFIKKIAYITTHQVVGRDFSENMPAVASLALAVGSSAGWLGHEARLKSKHTKYLPTS